MGCQKSRSFVWGAEWNISFCYNLFLQFLYYRKRNNRLKTGVSMLSYSVLERSNNPYIRKVFKKFNLLFKKNFKTAELLTKASFFLYFRDRPKNGERNKQRSRRKYTRQSNKTSKNYEQLTMYCFDCIFIFTSNLAYWIPISMFSLVSWFLYFLQHLLQ